MCHSSSRLCMLCKAVGILFSIVGVLVLVAATTGAYMAHLGDGTWTFGTLEGSFSLVALLLAIMLLQKLMKMCSCRKGGCGDACGGCASGHDGCGCGKEHCDCGKKA